MRQTNVTIICLLLSGLNIAPIGCYKSSGSSKSDDAGPGSNTNDYLDTDTDADSDTDTDSDSDSDGDTELSATYTVGGSVTGLIGMVTLSLNASDQLEITADGPFAFADEMQDGQSYAVTVVTQPRGQLCAVENGAGIIQAADITNVSVTCTGSPLEVAQIAYVKASNTDIGDYFGTTVALYDDTLAVGAPGEASSANDVNGDQDDNEANGSGAVYVFRRSGDPWSQEAYIKATYGNRASFGRSIALYRDTLAVGAHFGNSAATGVNNDPDVGSATDSGAAYVFRRLGTTWTQEAYVKASNTDEYDKFGTSIALHGDTLAVGANHEDSQATGINGDQDDNSAGGSGAVYVFRRTGDTWNQEAYVKASNTDAEDEFGTSVALYGDTLAVGAVGELSLATGVNGDQGNAPKISPEYGAVYLFSRRGETWSQEAYVKPSNTEHVAFFGNSLALYEDTLVVGAVEERSAATGVDGDQHLAGSTNGAVYVFRKSDGTWRQEAHIKASNAGEDTIFDCFADYPRGDRFGHSVALFGDTLLVGANQEFSAATGIDGDQSDNSAFTAGAAYLFQRSNDVWCQEAYIKASNTEGGWISEGAYPCWWEYGDKFGTSVAIWGNTFVVGAVGEDSAATGINGDQSDNSAYESGAAYLFSISE